MITPPYLKKGDTIGITCPAGYMPYEKAENCINALQAAGYHVVTGKTLGSASNNYFSGTDAERLDDFQRMLDDPEINAILFGRGGYGMSRIIEKIDFSGFVQRPKWIVGFSDITLLHSHIFQHYSISTLHAPMAGAFNDEAKLPFVQSMLDALGGSTASYTAKTFSGNVNGIVTAPLIGGNLALVAHAIGSASAYNTKGKILFLEDVGEYLYNVDRMMMQLKRSGKLDDLAGLVLGGFSDLLDTDRPFGNSIDELLMYYVKDMQCPVAFHFPISHDVANYAVKIGKPYKLTVTDNAVSLQEIP